jgi:hypothetical protein
VVQFLAIQVRIGSIILEQVPEKYRAEVEAILNDALGYLDDTLSTNEGVFIMPEGR